MKTRAKDLRLDHGFTFRELSNMTGVSNVELYRLEHGIVRGNTARKVAYCYNVNIGYLLGKTDELKRIYTNFASRVVLYKIPLKASKPLTKKWFRSSSWASLALNRVRNYVADHYRKGMLVFTSKDGQIYALAQRGRKKLLDSQDLKIIRWEPANGNLYVNTKAELERIKNLDPEEERRKHLAIGDLLTTIDIKYGGVSKEAEGTPELAELRKALNV